MSAQVPDFGCFSPEELRAGTSSCTAHIEAQGDLGQFSPGLLVKMKPPGKPRVLVHVATLTRVSHFGNGYPIFDLPHVLTVFYGELVREGIPSPQR